MDKPDVILALDEALKDHLPSGVALIAQMGPFRRAYDYVVWKETGSLPDAETPFQVDVRYRGALIRRTLGLMPGAVPGVKTDAPTFAVVIKPGHEKPVEQPRDPETGQFMSWEDTDNGL